MTLSRRPFAWKGEVYLGHWTAFMPIEERMSISLLDVDKGVVRFLYRFHQLRRAPALPAADARRFCVALLHIHGGPSD